MADAKWSAKSATTSPASADESLIIKGGASLRTTLGNAITKAHGLSDGLMKVASGTMSTVALTTASLPDSTDARYCTDAQKVVIGNTSGTNSGNEVAAQAIGFTITKGTTPKTLTVPLDASVSGTNTGDQSLPTDATIATTDVTTNDVSTSKHGWAPKVTNTANFLKGDGTWAAPPAGAYSRAFTKTVCAYNAVDHVNCDYICDGTNDQVEIQSAIDAVTTLGGTVKLSDGTFTLGAAINMKSYVWLEGSGQAGDWYEGFTQGTILYRSNTSNSILVASQTTNGIKISNILFDGKTVGGTGACINFDTNDVFKAIFEDNAFVNCGFSIKGTTHLDGAYISGNYFQSNNASGYPAIDVEGDNTIIGNTIDSDGSNAPAIRTNGSYSKSFTRGTSIIKDNKIYYGGADVTIAAIDSLSTENSIIEGNFIKKAGKSINVSGCKNASITGNVIQEGSAGGIYVDTLAGSLTISGNSIYYPSQTTDNTYDGIIIGNTVTGSATITGNSIFGKATANHMRYGIYTTNATQTNISIVGNSVSNAATGNINIASPYALVRNNSNSSSIEEKDLKYMKNTSATTIAAGALVTLKAVAAGNEITVSTTLGDPNLYGMNIASLTDTSWGYVQTLGKTTLLKVNGTVNIAIGDWITQGAGTAGIGVKAVAGNTVIAKALEAYSGADDNGVIDAIIVSPRTI